MGFFVGIHIRYISDGSIVKSLLGQETWVWSLGPENSLEKEMANPLQYSCLENPIDRGSLEGYSPWGCKESGTT